MLSWYVEHYVLCDKNNSFLQYQFYVAVKQPCCYKGSCTILSKVSHVKRHGPYSSHLRITVADWVERSLQHRARVRVWDSIETIIDCTSIISWLVYSEAPIMSFVIKWCSANNCQGTVAKFTRRRLINTYNLLLPASINASTYVGVNYEDNSLYGIILT